MEGVRNAPFEVRIDGTKPLPELITTVNKACDQLTAARGENGVIFAVDAAPANRPAWPGQVDIHVVRRWERAVQRIEKLSTISAVLARGVCFGPGLEILLAADLRMAVPGTRLVFSAGDGHVWTGMSLYRLARQCGIARARQVMTWRPELPAEEAAQWGLLDAVDVAATEAPVLVAACAARLSGREIALRRQLVQEAVSAEFDDALGVHLAACDRELRRLHAGR
jgi:isomerase DpgB